MPSAHSDCRRGPRRVKAQNLVGDEQAVDTVAYRKDTKGDENQSERVHLDPPYIGSVIQPEHESILAIRYQHGP